MPFDPNKPFEVIDEGRSGESGFDPSKPYEVIDEGETDKPAADEGPTIRATPLTTRIRRRIEDLAPSLLSTEGTVLNPERSRGIIPGTVEALSTSPLEKVPRLPTDYAAALASPIPAAALPESAKKFVAGGIDAAQGAAAFATSPIGMATAGLAGLGPAASRLIAAGFAPVVAKQAYDKVSEGIKNKDPRAIGEGVALLAMTGAAGKHALTPENGMSLAEMERQVDQLQPQQPTPSTEPLPEPQTTGEPNAATEKSIERSVPQQREGIDELGQANGPSGSDSVLGEAQGAEPEKAPEVGIPKPALDAAGRLYKAEKRLRRALRQEGPDEVDAAREDRISAAGELMDISEKLKLTQEQYDYLKRKSKETDTENFPELDNPLSVGPGAQTVGELGVEKGKSPTQTVPPNALPLKWLESAETWADKTIKSSKGRASSGIDPELMTAYAVKGAAILTRGTVRAVEWAAEMVRLYGEEIRSYLPEIRRRSDDLLSNGWPPERNIPTLSAGPGAASPGDVPTTPQEQQLIESLNALPPESQNATRITVADQLADSIKTGKDAFQKWWLRTKAGSEQYKRLLLGPPLSENDFWSTKKDWQANRQVNAGVARGVLEEGRRLNPNQLHRQAMGKYAEALMFEDPEAVLREWADTSKLAKDRAQYEQALKLSENQKTTVRQAIAYFEAKGKELQDAGLLNNMIEDYAGQHMVDRRGMGSPEMNQLRADLVRGTFNTNFKYAMRRVFETEAALERAGLKLKSTDLFDKLANYGKTANDVLADRAAVKRWMDGETEDGKPMFATGAHRIPIEGKEGVKPALLVNPKVRPDPKWTNPKTGEETDISHEYVKIDHPAFKKWQWADTEPATGKTIMVQGDVWAHKSIADELKNTFGRSHLYDVPGVGALTQINSQLKGLKLVGLFHQVKTGVHALTHLVSPFSSEKVNPHDPFTYDAMRSGLQLFETRSAEMFSEGLASSSILHSVPKIGPMLRAYQEYLFHDFIPRIKLKTYRAALERNKTRLGTRYSESEIKQITATQVNSAFGELNWKLLGINPTFQHGLRLALLAPDFQAAQHGFIAQMFTKAGRENQMSAAIMVAGVYTMARILNKIFDDDFHFEPRRAFGVVIGGREYGIRTIASDAQRAITDTSQFIYHRLSPTLSSAVELTSKVDSLGRRETGKQALKNVALRAVPMPVTPRNDLKFVESALASTFGYYTKRASNISDMKHAANEWRKKNFPRSADDQVEQYAISDYLPLKQALQDNRMADAQTELEELLHEKNHKMSQISRALTPGHPFTGSQAHDSKWIKSLSPADLKKYQDAREEEKQMFHRFRQLHQ